MVWEFDTGYTSCLSPTGELAAMGRLGGHPGSVHGMNEHFAEQGTDCQGESRPCLHDVKANRERIAKRSGDLEIESALQHAVRT